METSNTQQEEIKNNRPQAPEVKTYKARTQFATKTVSEWEAYDKIPLLGEMTIAIPDGWDKTTPFTPIIKIGDGINVWKDLSPMSGGGGGVEVLSKTDNTLNDEEFIKQTIDEKTLVDGLYIIVESETETGKQQTAYIYDVDAEGEGRLIALGGNYNADNIYFDSDIQLAGDYTSVGNIKLNEGTLQSKGKSLSELFDQIFTKELDPTFTKPSMTVTLNEAKKYEVGKKVTPTYTTTFNKGSYQYGPETGVTPQTYSVTFNGETLTTATGTFKEYIVEEGSKNISATINYKEGVYANTNLGNTSKVRIDSGSCSASSGNITGVRYNFWGKNGKDVSLDELTSDVIRGYATTEGSFKITTVGEGINNIIVAVKNGKSITKVIMPVSNNADVTTEFKNIGTKTVNGADGNLPTTYTIYKYQPASLDAKSDFEITIG